MSLPFPGSVPRVLAARPRRRQLALVRAGSPRRGPLRRDRQAIPPRGGRARRPRAGGRGGGKSAPASCPTRCFDFSWDRAHPTGGAGGQGDETGFALSQTLPWPGTRSAGVTRRRPRRRRPASGRRRRRLGDRGPGAARLRAARGGPRARWTSPAGAEEDARSLRDLVARRAELGESRESDRIKVSVEWLRQQRQLAAAAREAQVAEAILRALAVEPLPRPLVLKPTAHPPLPPLDPTRSPRASRRRTRACARRGRRRRGGRRSPPSPGAPASPTSTSASSASASSTRRRTASPSGSSCRSGTPTGARSPGPRPSSGSRPRRRRAERIDVLTELEARLTDLVVAGGPDRPPRTRDPAPGRAQPGARAAPLRGGRDLAPRPPRRAAHLPRGAAGAPRVAPGPGLRGRRRAAARRARLRPLEIDT